VYEAEAMQFIEQQLATKANLHTIAAHLYEGVEQLTLHLQQCIRQNSARGWEIAIDVLMEVPHFTVGDEPIVPREQSWYWYS
jgi:hypothetical protein